VKTVPMGGFRNRGREIKYQWAVFFFAQWAVFKLSKGGFFISKGGFIIIFDR
jgi:hypothetical protein